MSNKTNDEKLRILHERLVEISKKKERSEIEKEQETKKSENKEPKTENIQEKRKSSLFSWLKYLVVTVIFGYGIIFAYNNINPSSLEKKETIPVDTETIDELEYDLNLQGDNIVITATFEDESSAKSMVEDLKLKGFRANYFYLPNKSNSTEKVYKVFIGPYEHIEETNQWIKNLKGEIEIISL